MVEEKQITRRTLLSLAAIGMTGCISESDERPRSTGDTGPDETGEQDTAVDTDQNTGDTDQNGGTQNQEANEASATVGEIVSDGDLELIVSETRTATQLGTFSQASSGNEYVVVEIAIKNISGEFVAISNLLQTRVRDGEGYSYQQTFVGSGNTFNDGQLAPGEVERGELAFEIPQKASDLTLTFDFQAFAVFDFNRVSIDLSEEASSPGTVEQNLQENVFNVGETVEYNGTEVTVNEVETSQSLGRFAQPDSGNEYVIVDIGILNGTEEQQTVSTILQMMLKDGEGWSYQEDLMSTSSLDRGFDEGTPLAPGENRRGKLAYEIEQGLSPLYWVFEFTLWTEGDKSFWQLR